MKTLLLVLLCTFVLLLLAFSGIAIKVIVKKNGQFKRHCSSMDPYTGERGGCVCGNATNHHCKKQAEYQPLEVNTDLMDELNGK